MRSQNEKEDLAEIVRRVTKKRSYSSTENKRFTIARYRNRSESAITDRRRKSVEEILSYLTDETQLTDKISQWLLTSNDDITKEEDTVATSFHKNTSKSSAETRSPSSSRLNSLEEIEEGKLRENLLKEAIESQCIIEDVDWPIHECDILLRIDNTLFPIKKDYISNISSKFQDLLLDTNDVIVDKNANEQLIYQIHGYTVNEIRRMLNSVCDVGNEEITDDNVASFLQLSSEFGISRLRFQCENQLKSSVTFNPFIALQLSKQYDLSSLDEHAQKEISKIPNVENQPEFDSLDAKTQNQILRYILQRYHKASQTLSQFDIHLCCYHSSDRKNNTCCYRSATYNTENDRTFLVQMEKPHLKLVEMYQEAFDSSTL